MLSWLARVIKGIVIALGFILPGISGGVLAAILGIYERMIVFLAHPFKEFKENIRKYDFKENQEYQGLYLLMKYKNQAVAE